MGKEEERGKELVKVDMRTRANSLAEGAHPSSFSSFLFLFFEPLWERQKKFTSLVHGRLGNNGWEGGKMTITERWLQTKMRHTLC